MTLHEKQSIFVQNIVHLMNYIYSNGYSCTFGEAYRTAEQAEIYAKEGKGIINSLHCKRLAIDLNIFDTNGKLFETADQYKKFGDYWHSLHAMNRWGGIFQRTDSDHFEMQDL